MVLLPHVLVRHPNMKLNISISSLPCLAFGRQKCFEAVSEVLQHWKRNKPGMFENAGAVGLAIYPKLRSTTFIRLLKTTD
jgi:hypothetical protein